MNRLEDSDLAIPEIILRKWEHEWDDKLKAHIQRIADEMGCMWWDIVTDNRDLFVDETNYRWNLND